MSNAAVQSVVPGVVLKTKFVLPNNEAFQNYVEYVDRDEAKRNQTYDKYSTYSEGYGEIQKNKQKFIIREKIDRIDELNTKVKDEKEKCDKMKERLDRYESYKEYMNDFNSIQKLFVYESNSFSWYEKKELQNLFKDYTINIQEGSLEEKAFEQFSKYLDKYVNQKKEKLEGIKNKKEQYISKLEKRIESESEKIKVIEERLGNFDSYTDYMGNPEKTSALFTAHSNQLDKNEKKELKELFKKAHENGSIMWQDVISFHNNWLEEQGIYDSKTHTVDEKKLMDITRLSMSEMQKREGLEKTTVWSAAIHYNTDNIHIHIATVEPFPTRTRGKRKPKTLDAMKGKVINNILDRGEEQKKINDLIRKNMVGAKKENSTLRWKNRKLKPLFLEIYQELPQDDKRKWQYSMNAISHIKPKIDELSKQYINKYHQEDFKKFINSLDNEVKELRKAYGDGTKEEKRYEDYKKNKINELYKRMGNAFLQEIKEYDKQQKELSRKFHKKTKRSNFIKNFQQRNSLQVTSKKIEKAFRTEYEHWKAQREYERIIKQIENENEREQ